MTTCDGYDRVTDEHFGDKKYVTMAMLQKMRNNQDVHNCNIEELWKNTDPELRKKFQPIIADLDNSMGVVLDAGRNAWKFDDSISTSYNELFSDFQRIILEKTTAFVDIANNKVTMTPQLGAEVINAKCEGPWGAYRSNTHWYVAWDRTKPFWPSPERLADPLGSNMPSIARAETWTATASGSVSKVTLDIEIDALAEDDVWLELRGTTGGKPNATVLGRVHADLSKVKGGLVAFPFPKNAMPKVQNGVKYAWVLRSPFSSFEHHYGVGGWGRNCNADPYAGGEAFTSFDNCTTWVKHGRDEKLPYKEGMYAPVDFAFIVHTIPLTATYSTTTPEYVYFKPVLCNPITTVVLSVTDSQPTNTAIVYEVSVDGHNWFPLNAGNAWTKTFADGPQVLFVRARLSTTASGSTPEITQVGVHLDTTPALDSLLRTQFYNPRMQMPLGIAIWDELNAPFETEPNTSVTVEVVRGIEVTDVCEADGVFTSFGLSQRPAAPTRSMKAYVHTTDDSYVTFDPITDFEVVYDENMVVFDEPVPEGTLYITYNPVWMHGLTAEDFPLKCDFMEQNFTADGSTSKFMLKSIPCDPLRKVYFNGVLKEEVTDYTVNYDTGELDTLVNLSADTVISVQWTPALFETKLGFVYRMTRTQADKQAYLNPNYYQYRV